MAKRPRSMCPQASSTWISGCLDCCYFFFFQAEDGIRYLTVTGVQTCALPISSDARDEGVSARRLGRVEHGHRAGARRDHRTVGEADPLVPVPAEELVAHGPRSEERRVGKEGRSRWSPYH